MAKFQISSRIPIEEICLDSTPKPDGTQRHIDLQLVDWDRGHPPDIGTLNDRLIKVSVVAHNATARRSTFRIEATKDAAGTAYVWDKASEKDTLLRVVVGKVTNHDNFEHDLIADLLGRSEDPLKLWVYQRILAARNNSTAVERKDWDRLLADQPLKQVTDNDHPARWNCGTALNTFGLNYFGPTHYIHGSSLYYKTPFKPNSFRAKTDPNSISDIQFDENVLRQGIEAIRFLLAKKTAVTVFAVHDDGFSVRGGVIQATGKTHFLTIVGCDRAGKKFLYTDPWPRGSKLQYTSGIFGTVDSTFMSVLTYGTFSEIFPNANRLFKRGGGNRGNHDYSVLTGPS